MLSTTWDFIWKFLKIMSVVVVGYGLLLWVFQRKLMYFPSVYTPQILQLIDKEEIYYQVGGEQQVAYYIPPRLQDAKPQCLWVMFGGNAALALGWSELVGNFPDDRSAFLLIDYPGYGQNGGSPSIEGNMQAMDLAYAALLAHLSIAQDIPRPFALGVLGHSLGSAMAVTFADKYSVDMVMLLSPFTSMQAMVRHTLPIVGSVLNHFVHDKYEVEGVLDKLQTLSHRPTVVMIHGSDDGIVPVSMSRYMAQKYEGFVKYEEIDGADHNFVYGYLPIIIEKMHVLCISHTPVSDRI